MSEIASRASPRALHLFYPVLAPIFWPESLTLPKRLIKTFLQGAVFAKAF